MGRKQWLFIGLIAAMIAVIACTGVWEAFTARRGFELTPLLAVSWIFNTLAAVAAYMALARRRWRGVAWVGLVFAASAAAGTLLLVMADLAQRTWLASGPWRGPSMDWMDVLEQSLVTAHLFTGFFCFGSLLLTPRLKIEGVILQVLTPLAMAAAVVSGLASLWLPWRLSSGDLNRLAGTGAVAASILSGAGAAAIFVLAGPLRRTITAPPLPGLAMSVRCPRCQLEQVLQLGESGCTQCGLRFRIAMDEPRCRYCWGALRDLTDPACPHCARPYRQGLVRPRRA